jgi:hypothetical protein
VLGGIVFILAAILPVILGNREVQLQDTFDRYTLLASFGVVLVLGGGFPLIFSRRVQWAMISVLVAVSIMTQVLNTQAFVTFWQAERSLWWQLSWRAPDIKPGTVLLPYLPEPNYLVESYEIWGPANLIYQHADPLDISGEVFNQQTLHWISSGDRYGKTIRRVNITTDFSHSLIMSLLSPNSCLHVYDKDYPLVSEFEVPVVSLLSPASSWSQIDVEGTPARPPQAIFGKEPAHGWCYAYQKAALAYQQKDWNEIARLGDEAAANGLQPLDEMEWLPFYEAYARLARYDEANQIGETLRQNKSISEQFCAVYQPRINELQNEEYFMVVNICPQFSRE